MDDLEHCKAYTVDSSGEKPSFEDWLLKRYDITPMILYIQCKQTGRYGDYDEAMKWYRRRYQIEMDERECFLEANPFKQQEEN